MNSTLEAPTTGLVTSEADEFIYKASNSSTSVVSAPEGIVECIVAVIGNKDSVKDIILPGAFTESLLKRHPRVVWGHDWNHPIGKVLEIYEVSPSDPRLPKKIKEAGVGALYAKVQFNLKSEKGREAFAIVDFYKEDQEWSIGYKTQLSKYDPDRDANMLERVELYEVSPVLHGANQLTGTLSIKDGQVVTPEADEQETAEEKTAMGRRMLSSSMEGHYKTDVDIMFADSKNVIFRADGANYLVSYRFTGNDFMFGERKRVTVQVMARPIEEPVHMDTAYKSDEDVETKAGRVISNRNITMLRQASDLIGTVIKAATPEVMATVEQKEKVTPSFVLSVKDGVVEDLEKSVEELSGTYVKQESDTVTISYAGDMEKKEAMAFIVKSIAKLEWLEPSQVSIVNQDNSEKENGEV